MKILDHLASATLSVVILTATAFLPASAQSGPTLQEQMACRGDAGKFCAEHAGKPPEMNACLRDNKAKLSEPAARSWNPAAAEARQPRFWNRHARACPIRFKFSGLSAWR